MSEGEDTKTTGWLDATKSNAWTDLALTLPIFLGYHLGVVLLQVRNAADPVSSQLVKLAEHNIAIYWGLTLGIGAAVVALLFVLGRGESFDRKRFAFVSSEAVVYAFLMRFAAGYAVGAVTLGASGQGMWQGVVMSLGAGFYEEIAFRVGLYGLGALAIKAIFGTLPRTVMLIAWAVVTAMIFAGWHYVGPLSDAWDFRTFVFRATCGLVLTAIYVFRGFAPAVWTHTLYDVWALALAS
jgi:hypothetical protein